ncbi:MAG: PAS domain-containing protein [Pseudomonadota bacterium]
MSKIETVEAETASSLVVPNVPGTARLDPAGRMRQLDPAFLMHLGFSPDDDLVGLPFSCLWLHEARDGVETALRAARAGIAMRRDLALDYLLGDGAGRCTAIMQQDGDGIRVTLRSAA